MARTGCAVPWALLLPGLRRDRRSTEELSEILHEKSTAYRRTCSSQLATGDAS